VEQKDVSWEYFPIPEGVGKGGLPGICNFQWNKILLEYPHPFWIFGMSIPASYLLM
jgi:hypothetical protein